VSDFLVGALSLLLSTNQPVAISNIVTRSIGAAVVPAQDAQAVALREVMEYDDTVEREIDDLVRRFREGDPSDPDRPTRVYVEMQIEEQYDRIKRRYERFIKEYPDYSEGRVAYASFLEENGLMDESLEQLKKSVELDPENSAAWNNLAIHYGHYGGVINAFPAYEKAIALRPFEALYHYNYATTVFLFRKDAKEYFQCDEQEVFDRALKAYRKVRELRPDNFRYAYDYAQTYYGVQTAPSDTPEGKRAADRQLAETAIDAWLGALKIADNDVDRQGIHLHLARWNLRIGEWDAVRTNLSMVQHETHAVVKDRLSRNLEERESGTNP